MLLFDLLSLLKKSGVSKQIQKMIVNFFEREPKSFFLVIEDLDMKGTASTSVPFFSVSWARKGWEQQERDLTVPPHP